MGQVISATARRVQRQGGQGSKRQRFLTQAALLLADARADAANGRMDQALEKAYQAGLRTAGACVAASATGRGRGMGRFFPCLLSDALAPSVRY